VGGKVATDHLTSSQAKMPDFFKFKRCKSQNSLGVHRFAPRISSRKQAIYDTRAI